MDKTITNQEALIFILITFCILLIPIILFLITQQNTLKLVQSQNRTMSPGQVWLQLIPFFGLVWQFIVVSRIADSIEKEMATGGNTFSFEQVQNSYNTPSKPTYGIGIAYCILMCCSLIPRIGGIIWFAGIICWIIYWVKLHGFKNQLQAIHYNRVDTSLP